MTERLAGGDAAVSVRVVGRTGWDAVSEALRRVGRQAPILILFAFAAFVIYVFYDSFQKTQKVSAEQTIAERAQHTKTLVEAGALLNQSYGTLATLKASQVAEVERLFQLIRDASADAKKAEGEAKKAESEAKEALLNAARAKTEAEVAQRQQAITQRELKTKETSLAATEVVLSRKTSDLEKVKGHVIQLATLLSKKEWEKAFEQLTKLLELTGAPPELSFDPTAMRNAGKLAPTLEKTAPHKFEQQLTSTFIKKIQSTLCASIDGKLGDSTDSPTRTALSEFYLGYDHELRNIDSSSGERSARGKKKKSQAPPKTKLLKSPNSSTEESGFIDTPEKLAAISAAVKRHGDCNDHSFKDAFEVGLVSRYGVTRIYDVISKAASREKISFEGKNGEKKPGRVAIEELRNKFGLNSGLEGYWSDLIDVALLDATRLGIVALRKHFEMPHAEDGQLDSTLKGLMIKR
ncbi:hypothetical protein ACNJYD_04425 [Bradyrhizobium sp. DASA03005]|uniref:hypothetical protein n=1 Tax=Bradyrhizobium sp. SPXBL-02 TaxID=3395912 RepID=UPI003F709E89